MDIKYKDFTGASHATVREQLQKIQEYGGAAIRPLALYDVFYELLNDENKSPMNRSRVRDITETFCALCNEYYIINHFETKPKKEFFMTNERWDKYYLGQKARENSVKFLEHYGLIFCENRRNPYKAINTVRYYKFNLERLKILERMAKANWDKVNKKRKET